ncbi:hypothetical protein [Tautonia rosea]|uniref:hypothetical protein n=1 Tax=Tautonia rosea TaxID=2728037 RepID=UPI0014737241|nr:hypothetical protein [Tautonia rosea]
MALPLTKRRLRTGGPKAGLPVSAPLRREAANLLDLQLWCWGLDIRRPQGNALIGFGFQRIPVAEGGRGTSAYQKPLDEGRTLVLWGSGLVLTDPVVGAVAVRRFEFRLSFDRSPTLTSELLAAGSVPELGPILDPDDCGRAHRLVLSVFEAIIAYESWAIDHLGPGERQRGINAWPKLRIPAEQLVSTWQDIANRWRVGMPLQSSPTRADLS